MGEMVTLGSENGRDFQGYLARPRQAQGPGVVVLQEIFGVNAFIRSVADRFAAAGFFSLAPELYWRQQSGVQLNSDDPEDVQRALALLGGLTEEQTVADCERAVHYLRAQPGVTGKCAAMGYCLGGKLSYLLAARSSIDAGIAYYGTYIQHALHEAANMKAPILLHIAAEDVLCPPEAQQQIIARMNEVRPSMSTDIDVFIYEGAKHGFSRTDRSCYTEAAAQLADQRTLQFLQKHLG